jgi:hypothetical protein
LALSISTCASKKTRGYSGHSWLEDILWSSISAIQLSVVLRMQG